MKKCLKTIGLFVASAMTAIIIIYAFDAYLDRQIDAIYDVDKYTKAINTEYEDLTKDKGNVILEKSIENDNIMLLGSSELGSWVGQNPVNMFPNSTCDQDVTIVGQAYVQDLLHSMKVGTKMFEGEKKLAIVVSLQWFFGDDIDTNGFAANFSEYQFYQLLENDNLSKESKLYICSRTSELLEEIQGYDDIKVYAWLYSKDSALGKAGLTVLHPYYAIREKVLSIKDKWNTYTLLKSLGDTAKAQKTKKLDWKKEEAKADKEGKKYCTNNEFYVEDNYYDTYLKDTIEDSKDCMTEENMISREMEDYEMFLQICKENDVKPYIIIMNTNGKYYDYVGVPREKREKLYNTVEEKAEEYGFDCLNLSDKEYEPYFMVDVMHLGWKGWLYVDQQMSEYFSENSAK